MQIDQLIKELIATGTMNDDTLAELNRMLGEYTAGKLDPDDEVYLRALHARLTSSPLPADAAAVPAGDAGPDRLDGQTLSQWRDRALKAEAELEALRAQRAGGETGETA